MPGGGSHGFLQPNPALLVDLDRKKKKSTLAHDLGAGMPCMKCKERCPGFQLHFWRFVDINVCDASNNICWFDFAEKFASIAAAEKPNTTSWMNKTPASTSSGSSSTGRWGPGPRNWSFATGTSTLHPRPHPTTITWIRRKETGGGGRSWNADTEEDSFCPVPHPEWRHRRRRFIGNNNNRELRKFWLKWNGSLPTLIRLWWVPTNSHRPH